ncbi:coenzyme F420-dependent N(5),N(10)-methenyltetrahydromethanopterin reductase-related protein [Methanocaldococcus vulcanius M7]|uniref:Coenzyme F420-dependent N(5),N(10)-methenyltetrahydromethanopterin reductase-related protein n=1 Tax=Methanocaldococcus vulcanius (strain ATCC 700851 / DSM 12094 / M7) TaxID=579137 RepID=C9RI71_METVM|nr:H(2)-dependent methylenetetrahydromethanopterin dehydrogenase-related protein [Methanocaldococcus vulcanius]ACX73273.1 coenzyme F420-dependent N(5),N(10)-methenyltetrahydromethanopterin reductase-related protein [Methanocaldococcus vulcanius M7]
MKVSVYGAGNQKLYLEKLNVQEKFGGEPPYGGSRMAIEFAKAGHDVVLAEPNRGIMSEDLWRKVEEAGVKVVSDDVEAAKHGEVHILFTPFGKLTIHIAKTIIEHLPQNAVICNTCTIPTPVLYRALEGILRLKRRDVGISSMHPTGVPGTPSQEYYTIAGRSLEGKAYATEEQINKLVELVESINKIPYVAPADVVPAVADMGALVTAVSLVGVLDYYRVGTQLINAPKDMIEKQILISLQTISSIIETSGIEGLMKVFNKEALLSSAKNMLIDKKQDDLKLALKIIEEFDKSIIGEKDVKKTYLVAPQALIEDIISLIGKSAVEGAIRRSSNKLFSK